jgi:phosphoglycerate dehydrogenase-like enzyme
MESIVLSLTPAEVIGPVHAQLAGELAPHVLTYDADLATADFIIGDWTHAQTLPAARIDQATRCRGIFQPTAGVEDIDLEAAAARGIPVTNAPGTNDVAVAEWTVMAILALLKDVWRHHAGVLNGRWDMVDAARTGVYELAGRTVGIVGMGRIGQAVARRIAAFEPGRLLYADERPAPVEIERVALDALLAASDVVTLHVPHTPATTHLIDARRLALLRPGAILVNAARGAVVDEDALVAARHLRLALDVFAREPLPPGHPLREHPGVLLSPHLAGSTNEARRRMLAGALANLGRVLRGAAPANVVNGVRPRSG